jgi:hypothetical protein
LSTSAIPKIHMLSNASPPPLPVLLQALLAIAVSMLPYA